MKITWNDLTVDFSHIESEKLTEDWTWLIGNEMTPILVSSIGDMFLSDQTGKIYWLEVGRGIFQVVADSIEEFKTKMKNEEIANEWFMFDLVAEIKESEQELSKGKLYSFKELPILGGDYTADNFVLTDIEVHFSLDGQIHKKIKDLPDGTKINVKIE